MYNVMNDGTSPPLFCCCKDGHNTGQNIGTKTWQKVSV